MLNVSLPSLFARRVGFVVLLATGAGVSGLIYAATAPAAALHPSSTEYQLDMAVDVSSDGDHQRHSQKANLALCVKPGEKGSVSVHAWSLDATVSPDEEGRVRVTLNLQDGDGAALAMPRLQGALGQTLHDRGTALDGKRQYAMDITPRAGCPARDKA